ncbi:hypothetical protein TIFTF001_018512 [Ficus carica]|uniref:Uncharacterized protein n=1 Tax=Ficus carica TaxID=3494 RepID=A0AA88A769_FICCA|nr:hypothetical protein TIFTF001_018512 [Ficus carica]
MLSPPNRAVEKRDRTSLTPVPESSSPRNHVASSDLARSESLCAGRRHRKPLVSPAFSPARRSSPPPTLLV